MKTISIVGFLLLVFCCTADNVSPRECVMRWLATLAVVVVSALMSPTAASGYTFGDWASDEGYNPDAVMPGTVWANNSSPAIDSLDGINEFDWNTTPTTKLVLPK